MACVWVNYPWASFDFVLGATCILMYVTCAFSLHILHAGVQQYGQCLLWMTVAILPLAPILFLSPYDALRWTFGDLPVLSEYLIVITAAALGRLRVVLEQYPRLAADADVAAPLNRLDGGHARPGSRREPLRRLMAWVQQKGQAADWRWFERGLKRGRSESLWRRVRWLRLANGPLRNSVGVGAVLTAPVLGTLIFVNWFVDDPLPPLQFHLWTAALIALGMGRAVVGRIGGDWGSRLSRRFENELLRPLSRDRLRHQLLLAISIDTSVLYVIGLLLYATSAILLGQRQPDAKLALDILLLGSTAGVSLITTGCSFVLSPDWGKGIRDVLSLTIWLVSLLIVVAIPDDTGVLLQAIAIHILLCVVGLMRMRRYWERLEVA